MIHFFNFQNKVIRHISTSMCLEASPSDNESPVIAACTNNDEQNWDLLKFCGNKFLFFFLQKKKIIVFTFRLGTKNML